MGHPEEWLTSSCDCNHRGLISRRVSLRQTGRLGMRSRFIAATMVLISLWSVSAPLALAKSIPSSRQTAALRTHACCPREHSALALPIFVSPPPSSMPCGGQSPCCAKQAPAKPALLAFNQQYRLGLESTPAWTNETKSSDGAGAIMTSVANLSPSLYLHSTVLRN